MWLYIYISPPLCCCDDGDGVFPQQRLAQAMIILVHAIVTHVHPTWCWLTLTQGGTFGRTRDTRGCLTARAGGLGGVRTILYVGMVGSQNYCLTDVFQSGRPDVIRVHRDSVVKNVSKNLLSVHSSRAPPNEIQVRVPLNPDVLFFSLWIHVVCDLRLSHNSSS